MNYFKNKEQRAEKARRHTEKMSQEYGGEISMCVFNTLIYDNEYLSMKSKSAISKRKENDEMEIVVEETDSVSAVLKHAGKNKTAVLNFASYKNPGGMFINGSSAQEESLCHESYLYNVISNTYLSCYYEENKKKLNRALYTNKALYTPDVLFFRDKQKVKCDVITCAAPNKTAAQKYQHVSDEENSRVLTERIKFVLDIAAEEGVDTLILGAYGAGVFGQDIIEVAKIFKQLLIEENRGFSKVIFAVIKNEHKHYEAMKGVFDE